MRRLLVSLYTKLPCRFCFEPKADLPWLLKLGPWTRRSRIALNRLKLLKQIANTGKPVFWWLDFSDWSGLAIGPRHP